MFAMRVNLAKVINCPQNHSPGVDYSLFIMETVDTLLGEMETTPAALRRSFPPPICRSRSLFHGFSVYGRLLAIYVGTRGAIFIVGFRSRRSRGRKDRRQRSHEAPEGGPDRKSTRLNSSHITRSRMPSSA